MNFDDIKKSWQEQDASNPTMDIKELSIKESNLPLEKIRNNVKKEIWIQLVSVFFVAFTPRFFSINESRIGGFYLFYALFVLISLYYIFKMYLFYRKSAKLELNSKDSIHESYYSIKMYIQLYEAFCYSLFPFCVLFLLITTSNKKLTMILSGELTSILEVSVFVFLMFVLIHFMLRYWIKKFYGQYLAQIEMTLGELKEE